MRFGIVQKSYFIAEDGAYSVVTKTEVGDSQITLTGEESELVTQFFGVEGIHRGNVSSNREKAQKTFFLFLNSKDIKEVTLNLVFCKPDKNELRLYLKKDLFKPLPGQIWFIFVASGKIHIGAMNQVQWRSLGREDVDDDIYISDIYQKNNIIKYGLRTETRVLNRNPQLAIKRFGAVNYRCEIDPSHKLFTARSTNQPFLEAHHLLPLKYQNEFSNPLDIIENIVALCPHCHRLIHHATVDQTRPLLETIFAQREQLKNRFQIDHSRLYRLYNCEDIL